MTNATKKTEKPVQWRWPYAAGNEAKPAKEAGKKEKKPRAQSNRPKKYKPKRTKTMVKANPEYGIDPRVDEVFANKIHAFRFRVAMLSTRVRDQITVYEQLELAAKVEAEIDALEIRLGRSVPSDVVAQLVDAMVIDMERAA